MPDRFSAKQEWRRRKAIFKAFRAIWQARRYDTVPRRYLKVVRTYRHSQPEAVATLRRDLRSTITYYRLKQPLWVWDRKHLRTTSRLECLNVESAAELGRHVPTIRTKAFSQWSPRKPIYSMPHNAICNFHRI